MCAVFSLPSPVSVCSVLATQSCQCVQCSRHPVLSVCAVFSPPSPVSVCSVLATQSCQCVQCSRHPVLSVCAVFSPPSPVSVCSVLATQSCQCVQCSRYPVLSVCAVFSSVQTMLWLPVLGIFNVRTDVDAYGCHGGCTDTVRESALKADSGRTIP